MTEHKTWRDYCAANDLTRLLDVIHADTGRAPCCHWGTRRYDFDRYAVALALAFEDGCGGDYSDPDLMDGVMSQIVNDSEGRCAYTIMNSRHAYPPDFLDWLDPELFTDNDEHLEARFSDIASMASAHWQSIHNLRLEVSAPWFDWDSAETAPFHHANDLKWGAVTDYWAEKEMK